MDTLYVSDLFTLQIADAIEGDWKRCLWIFLANGKGYDCFCL